MVRIRSASRFQIRYRPAKMAPGVWIFAARLTRNPSRVGPFAPSLQHSNIAVTEFGKHALLDPIRTPDDLRKLKIERVLQVADELCQEPIDAVSVTGGHFGAGL